MFPFSPKHGWLTFAAVLLMSPLSAAASGESEYDTKSAVIFSYFMIGHDDSPSSSVTTEQFMAQIDELATGGYSIKPLSEIVTAFAAGKPLPPKTVALTFDGADQSVIDIALPELNRHDMPFTVFIPADKIGSGTYMGWSDLRTLKRNPLASFGIHPSSYGRLAGSPAGEIRRQINSSITALRDHLGIEPQFFAYPFGEYDAAYEKTVRDMGIKAAFGQQSGAAYAGHDLFALPRFTQTERYGDLERFEMTANALPLPALDLSPADPSLKTASPAIGFTVPDSLAKSLKSLSCFSSSREKPALEIMNTRVEIRMETPFTEERPRINCTMPVAATDGGEARWRWFGTLYTIPSELLQAEEPRTIEKTSGRHSPDISYEFSLE